MKEEKIQYKNTEKFTPEVIEEVMDVKTKYGLTAETLLKTARRKSSLLYGFFDWDDSSAGEKWRLQQARGFINEIKIVVEDKELYAFESVTVSVEDENPKSSVKKATTQREYKSIVEIMSKEEYRVQLVQRALAEATYWKERHFELNELQSIFSLIDKTNEEWQNKK